MNKMTELSTPTVSPEAVAEGVYGPAPDGYEAALFKGRKQVTRWVSGPPCRFGRVKRGSADRYKIRIPDGRVYVGYLPAYTRPNGGEFTLVGPFRWSTSWWPEPGCIVRES